MTTSAVTNIATDGWIAIATLLRPQGRRGELLSDPLSDVEGVFSAGRSVLLSGKTAAGKQVKEPRTLEEAWRPTGRNASRIVLKLSGCESINDAEAIAGLQVLIAADDMPALEEDTYFVGDLVGCAFFDGDEPAGKIIDVEFPVGSDGRRLEDAALLLVVEVAEVEEPVLVPFVRAWLKHVDVRERRVVMNLPAGLLSGDAEIFGEEDEDETEESDAI
ncbi:ribosome maturation factor RimM [Granulicella paludicola]|uniref:ribosome maturation factor RimM n=1 Tax=Granulicella paludicola TaxID=474951 RepID=UPI0021E051F7|nr:ribosome maturation factor RimM [Granulicella paludicola]